MSAAQGAPKGNPLLWVAGLALGLLLSVGGVQHVKQSEGLEYVAYPDPATGGDPWTICYGHTGKDVRRGLRATQAQCDRWLAQDLLVAQRAVQRDLRVPLKQGELDAYTSFVFNVGEPRWRDSTMRRKLQAGDRLGACEELIRFVYANKKVMRGLVTRRVGERDMCFQGGPYVWRP